MAREVMGNQFTIVRLNRRTSVSVETTIPDWLARLMELGPKDELEWKYDQTRKRASFAKTGRKAKS
jgi:hypothetical protein